MIFGNTRFNKIIQFLENHYVKYSLTYNKTFSVIKQSKNIIKKFFLKDFIFNVKHVYTFVNIM